jgi:hypothetical protein
MDSLAPLRHALERPSKHPIEDLPRHLIDPSIA